MKNKVFIASVIAGVLLGFSGVAFAAVGGSSVGDANIFKQVGNVISPTSPGKSLAPSGGGTGTSTNPTYGQVPVGNANGTYTLTATSSLGIVGGTLGTPVSIANGGTATSTGGNTLGYEFFDGTKITNRNNFFASSTTGFPQLTDGSENWAFTPLAPTWEPTPELTIQTNDGGNTLALQNLNPTGFSSLILRNPANTETGAFYDASDDANGGSSIETSDITPAANTAIPAFNLRQTYKASGALTIKNGIHIDGTEDNSGNTNGRVSLALQNAVGSYTFQADPNSAYVGINSSGPPSTPAYEAFSVNQGGSLFSRDGSTCGTNCYADIVAMSTTTPDIRLAHAGVRKVDFVLNTSPNRLDLFDTDSSVTPFTALLNGLGWVGVSSTTPGSLLSVGTTNGINFSTATSTFNATGGVNLASGCFAIGGTCIGGSGGGSGTVNTGTAGQTAYYLANGTAVSATSSISFNTNNSITLAALSSNQAKQDVGIGTVNPGYKLQVVTDYGDTDFPFDVASSTSAGTNPNKTDLFRVDASGNTTAFNKLQVGGTSSAGIITGQTLLTTPFSPNTDPMNAGRMITMLNTDDATAGAGAFSDLTLSLANGDGLGSGQGKGRVVEDIRAVRTTASSSDATFYFSGFNGSGTYTDYANIASTTAWFKSGLGIGTTTPQAPLTVVAASSTAGTVTGPYTGLINIIAGLENTTLKLFQEIDMWGDLIVSGDAPTLTSCTGGSVVSASNQRAGAVIFGTGLTSCGVLFAHPYPSGTTVHVFVNQDTGTLLSSDATSMSTTGFTITAASIATGDQFSYQVIATQ